MATEGNERGGLPIASRLGALLDDALYRAVRLVTRPSRRLRRHLEHSPLTGRLVRWRGNVASVDGLRFSVDSPVISDAARAPFVYGSYEAAERHLLRAHLDPALPVVELGGSVGVLACLTNRRLDDPCAHVVVEANPFLIPVLEANRARNRCSFTVVHRAIAQGAAQVPFEISESFTASHAGRDAAPPGTKRVDVRAATLEALVDDAGFAECTLVCDVEGAEWGLVRHEAETLRRRVRWIIIELHPDPVTGGTIEELRAAIRGLGFDEVEGRGESFVFRNREARADAA